jgi:hypothetical protein
MSQIPASPENMTKAFELLHERVKPAVLERNNHNGMLMARHIVAAGHNVFETDAQTLADLMYNVCCAKAEDLQWKILPKKLKIQQENNRPGLQDGKKFEENARDAAAAAAAKKASDKSRGVTAGIISQMQLSSKSKTADQQLRLHGRVERMLKMGIAWTSIENDIRSKITELHTADERAQERVGQYRDLLSEVEV